MTRSGILALILGALTIPAGAQPMQQQMARCQAMTGALQRLACYDALNKGAAVPPAQSAPAPGRIPPANYSPPPPSTAYAPPPAELGAERLPQSASAARRQPNRVVSAIEKFDLDIRGRFILTLANGQVWKQIEGDDDRAPQRKSARFVTIVRAVFGSYSLTFNDATRLYKVTRVQ